MSTMTLSPELLLPWESTGDEDRRFHKVLRNMLLVLSVLAIVVPWLPLSEPVTEILVEEPPSLAHIILQEKVLPEPDWP